MLSVIKYFQIKIDLFANYFSSKILMTKTSCFFFSKMFLSGALQTLNILEVSIYSSKQVIFTIINVKKYLFSLGSMVQKGKFSAAMELLVRTLKKVDFPTFGTPTMPTRKLVPTRPIRGFFSGS